MVSNLDVLLAIAEEALAESELLEKSAGSPRPDGEPGSIVKYDPEKKSFKRSLVAITFAGVYLEALLYVVGISRLGKAEYSKIDRKHYEEKLKRLGLDDSELLAICKRFREARNDLVHEKALDVTEIADAQFHFAQREAKNAITFVKRVTTLLRPAR